MEMEIKVSKMDCKFIANIPKELRIDDCDPTVIKINTTWVNRVSMLLHYRLTRCLLFSV